VSEKIWSKLTKRIIKAGIILPFSDTLIEILKTLITEEQAKFLLIFNKPSLTIDQIRQKTDLDDRSLEKMLNNLMDIGIIDTIPKPNTDLIGYNLVPFAPELFERTLMRGGTSEKEKKLGKLYEKFYGELTQMVQDNYDVVIQELKNSSPWVRVVPVEQEVKLQQQIVLPYEEISKIVEKIDIIGVGYCYCRHGKDLIGEPCKLDAPKETCIFFSDIAQFLIDHDFIRQISKDEALKILLEAEEHGLVHNTFYYPDDPKYSENAICSCCKCCCAILSLYHSGLLAMNSMTSYLAKANEENCVGCGTCVEKCQMEAIDLVDGKAIVNVDRCIGCGLCSHNCPEDSMKLTRTGLRHVFVPPPKLLNI